MSDTDPAAILLEELTWPEIQDMVAAGSRLCVLPIGATEQHGRHLPTGTDSLIVEAICRGACARTATPVLPTLTISSSHAHTQNWPGTLSYPPRLVIEMVVELASWVHASGFERLLLVNGHAGNQATLKVAVEEIRWRGTPLTGLVHWFSLTPEIKAAVESDADDWHANAAETSLLLHLRPELVRVGEIRDDPDRTEGLVFSYSVVETSIDGLTGYPSRGSREHGAQLFETAVAALADLIERARREMPPLAGAQQSHASQAIDTRRAAG
jgi:creatinine amidohydrolase